MRNKFDRQLKMLNKEMKSMCGMIEDAIEKSIEALFDQDVKKAKKIVEIEDDITDQQKKIENICFQLLIQQQPVARDLRTITAAMKMVTDMSRIGDNAGDISELTIVMAENPYVMKVEKIQQMSKETILMLNLALEAYVEKNMEKARAVIGHDDIVDDLFLEVKAGLVKTMKENHDYEEQAADLLMVNKYLERIGDHAVNIAEWVIFAINADPEVRI